MGLLLKFGVRCKSTLIQIVADHDMQGLLVDRRLILNQHCPHLAFHVAHAATGVDRCGASIPGHHQPVIPIRQIQIAGDLPGL